MRNILKASTLESKFPLLAVEDGCILSKDADVTVGFKVRLPEIFTLTSDDYEPCTAHEGRPLGYCPAIPSSTVRTGSLRRATGTHRQGGAGIP